MHSEERYVLPTLEMGSARKMLGDIFLFWVVGVPAAVITATELGFRLRERRRLAYRPMAHDCVRVPSQPHRRPRRSAASSAEAGLPVDQSPRRLSM